MMSRASLAFVLVVPTVALACEREAPGPAECRDLAVSWARAEAVKLRGARPGEIRVVVDERALEKRTLDCITTPYDRKLLECAKEVGSPRFCLTAFEDRRQRRKAQR